jgi:uncharacterized protein HemX
MRLKFWKRGEPGGTEEKPGEQSAAPAQEKPATGQGPAARPATTEERIEGLQASVAQVDRKLGIRTYAIGAGVVLALAAGIVGVVLAISAKDESATKDEVRALRDQVGAVSEEATQAAEESVQSLSARLDSLESRLNELSSSQRTADDELSVVKDDIQDLRNQISDLETSAGASDTGAGDTTPGDQQSNQP